jgi:hypothetical protein
MGLQWFEDEQLRERHGLVVAFSGRCGGVSESPYESLNLAGHVGDVSDRVNENRRRLLAALGVEGLRHRLITAEQVHGAELAAVRDADAGSGAFVERGRPPVAGTDALMTGETGLPLMLLYADCVPIVVVAPTAPLVAVVHAGWRGALAGLPGTVARSVAAAGGIPAEGLVAYVGPHICAGHYEVGDELVSQFVNRWGTVAEAEPGYLDLGAVVSADLSSAGVSVENICRLGLCTAEATDTLFSYRASSGITGRHAAVAVILK